MATSQIDGMSVVLRKLDDLENRLSDFTEVLEKTAKVYYDYVGDIFDTEGAAGSGKWAPLAPLTVTKRGGSAHPILDHHGQLKHAATTNLPVDQYGVSGDQYNGGKFIELYLSGDKVRNNFGFTNDRGFQVPKREFWPFGDKEADMLMNPWESWADDWLKS